MLETKVNNDNDKMLSKRRLTCPWLCAAQCLIIHTIDRILQHDDMNYERSYDMA